MSTAKPRISIIAAIGKNRELGKAGSEKLLWHIPEDFAHFKKITLGKPVIMGLNTFRSLGKPLPGRMNIVLSKEPLVIEGVTVVASFQEAYAEAQKAGTDEIFNIGGASIYAQGLQDADRLYLTLIDADFADADVFFPAYETLFTRTVKPPVTSGNEKFCYQFVTLEK
ncbi:MAG: dihydrofolate reductase [Minisyncoccia bacterium]